MWPRTHVYNHPTAPLLDHYATPGCPSDYSSPWKDKNTLNTLKYGLHSSSIHRQEIDVIHEKK